MCVCVCPPVCPFEVCMRYAWVGTRRSEKSDRNSLFFSLWVHSPQASIYSRPYLISWAHTHLTRHPLSPPQHTTPHNNPASTPLKRPHLTPTPHHIPPHHTSTHHTSPLPHTTSHSTTHQPTNPHHIPPLHTSIHHTSPLPHTTSDLTTQHINPLKLARCKVSAFVRECLYDGFWRLVVPFPFVGPEL